MILRFRHFVFVGLGLLALLVLVSQVTGEPAAEIAPEIPAEAFKKLKAVFLGWFENHHRDRIIIAILKRKIVIMIHFNNKI